MTNDELQIAHTIRQQLGGHRFIAMTGANNFCSFNKTDDRKGGLSFMIPARGRGVRSIRIYLNWNDTYTMEFCRIHKNEHIVVNEVLCLYVENLPETFTKYTGLYTSL